MKIVKYIFYKLFSLNKIEVFIQQNNGVSNTKSINISYLRFWIANKYINYFKQNQSWLIFFIDTSATLINAENLNCRYEVKSLFYLAKKKFDFLTGKKIYFPVGDIRRKGFFSFLINEIISFKIGTILILIYTFAMLFNSDINLLEKLVSLNINIITLFITIYLVFISLQMNKGKEHINEFYSGHYHKRFEDNRNVLILSFISLLFSFISLTTINYKINFNNDIIINFARFVGRYRTSLILLTISILFTYYCLSSIINYYLKLNKYDFYDKCIDKIIDDQKE